MKRFTSRRPRGVAVAFAGIAVLALATALTALGASSPPDVAHFQLFPQTALVSCLSDGSGTAPSVHVRVRRHELNDTLDITLNHFKPGIAFDLFTIQNSPQQADGTPVVGFNGNFGLAWYQTDLQVGDNGHGEAVIKTILLDQIFGLDTTTALPPTNTFHVGFWFNDPADAASCGFTGSTPFNGEHHAGPLAFVTRPDATTNLGPLCVNPDTSHSPATCNP